MEEERKIFGKVIIIGNSRTGKTCFMNKVVNNRFTENYRPTIGADFLCKEYQIGEKIVTLQMWDNAGEERFQTLGAVFYRGAQAYLIFFDVANRSSFERVREWNDQFINNIGNGNAFGVLVGNKIDLSDERVVTYEEGKACADTQKLIYLEASAKTGQGCKNLERIIANKISGVQYIFDS